MDEERRGQALRMSELLTTRKSEHNDECAKKIPHHLTLPKTKYKECSPID